MRNDAEGGLCSPELRACPLFRRWRDFAEGRPLQGKARGRRGFAENSRPSPHALAYDHIPQDWTQQKALVLPRRAHPVSLTLHKLPAPPGWAVLNLNIRQTTNLWLRSTRLSKNSSGLSISDLVPDNRSEG